MADIQIEAGTLTANREDRTVSGLLLPIGEFGRSNLGKVKVRKGAITIPDDVAGIVGLNVEHVRENSVGRAATAHEQAEGIFATFSIAKGAEGDQVLADIESGTRRKLSAEVKNIVIRAGEIISGALFGAAVVRDGAFPSATLLASDTEYVEEVVSEWTDADGNTYKTTRHTKVERDANTTTETTVVVTEEPATPAVEEEEPLVAAAVVPNTFDSSTSTTPRPLAVHDVGALYARRAQGLISDLDMATALEGQNGNSLFAALSDVKYDGTGGLANAMSPTPQWLGQVWQATTYRQQILPLFAHGNLTALTFAGFKWGTRPAGGDWAGNKAAVPSNTLTVSPVSGTASRYAIGHDIAREFVDFPVEGFFESYAAAVSEDYAKWADNKVAAAAVAGATTLAADALTTLPGSATGNIGSAASAIIDGITAIITTGSLPDFALVAPGLWKQMAKTPQTNILGYLNASLGLQEGSLDGFTIRPSAAVAAGKVLVGVKAAATVLELPGAPIRIDALDLARGGVDKAAFGYLGININDALGLQLVTAATA